MLGIAGVQHHGQPTEFISCWMQVIRLRLGRTASCSVHGGHYQESSAGRRSTVAVCLLNSWMGSWLLSETVLSKLRTRWEYLSMWLVTWLVMWLPKAFTSWTAVTTQNSKQMLVNTIFRRHEYISFCSLHHLPTCAYIYIYTQSAYIPTCA